MGDNEKAFEDIHAAVALSSEFDYSIHLFAIFHFSSFESDSLVMSLC